MTNNRWSLPTVGVLVAALVGVGPVMSAGASSCPDPAREPDEFATLVRDPDAPDEDDDVYSVQLASARLDPEADNAYDVVLNGGGFGHGIGMSQYGARGAAELGCTAEQILTTYFPGTALGTQADGPYSVAVFPTKPGQTGAQIFGVRSRGASVLSWKLDGEHLIDQPPDDLGAWYVCAVPGGGFSMHTTGTCGDNNRVDGVAWPVGGKDSKLTVSLDPELRIAQATYNGRRFGRGTLTMRSRVHSSAPADMSVTIAFGSIDKYLYGLGEVPSSWPAESLKAQAILARAYAVTSYRDKTDSEDGAPDDCDCRIYPTTWDQAYVGLDKEDPAVLGQYASAWPAAVDATTTSVLTYDFDDEKPPVVVRGFYSSSHGGVSADPYQVWGTDPKAFPYLRSVNTSAWEDYGASKNHLHRWSRGWTNEELAVRFGLDTFNSIEITAVETGGRPSRDPRGAVVTGTVAGDEVQKTYSGEELRSKLGLHSGLANVAGATPPPPAPTPAPDGTWKRLAGDGRIDTAVALSADGWDTSEHVLLARADHPADALAGSSLAGALDAPLLLTSTSDLPQVVRDELTRLAATTVWILGGPNSVSPEVEAVLTEELGLTVERVAGPDRFATAVEIGRRLPALAESKTAYIIRGRADVPAQEWADALAVSGIAARRGRQAAAFPILGVSSDLPGATADALAEFGIERVIPVGGPNTVPETVLAEIADLGVTVDERLAGDSRWDTSRAVAMSDTVEEKAVVLATGNNFPDGLAAGPYAARKQGVLLLVPSTFTEGGPWTGDGHDAYLSSLTMAPSLVLVAGGPNSVGEGVAVHVLDVLEDRF